MNPVDEDDQGRVKVFVRIRPPTDKESSSHEPTSVVVTNNGSAISVNDGKKDSMFMYDRVFPSESTNKQIFDEVAKPIVHAALNGFNGTLMAYGQTGTGKTHTLTSSDGMTPRLINHLFARIRADSVHAYKIRCAYMQLYNEKIYDLLPAESTKGSKSPVQSPVGDDDLQIRESTEKGIFVEGLTEYIVHSPQEVFELIKQGRSKLVIAETKMNRTSSRSHAICYLTVERSTRKDGTSGDDYVKQATPEELAANQKGEQIDLFSTNTASEVDDKNEEFIIEDDETGKPTRHVNDVSEIISTSQDIMLRGRITICDLAGSERVKKTFASGALLTESQQINLSLLELGNCISALASNKSHIPFRNSTLTRLLQESLGGNCKTRLIVCVAPCRKDISETKGTLSFGYRAMRVSNNARVNVEVDYKALVDSLAEQMRVQEIAWREREHELLARIDQMSKNVGGSSAQMSNLRQAWQDSLALLQAAAVIAAVVSSRDPSRMSLLSSQLDPLWNQIVAHDSISRKVFSRTYKVLETTAHHFAKNSKFPPVDETAKSVVSAIGQHCLLAIKTLSAELRECCAWCTENLRNIDASVNGSSELLISVTVLEKSAASVSDTMPESPIQASMEISSPFPTLSSFSSHGAFVDYAYHAVSVTTNLYSAVQQIQLCVSTASGQGVSVAPSALQDQFEQLSADFKDLQTRHDAILTQQKSEPSTKINNSQGGTQTDHVVASDTTQTDLTMGQAGDLEILSRENAMLEARGDKMAASCRVGGKDCTIM